MTALCQHGLPDQNGSHIRTFTLMDLPTNNFAAEDVHDQIQIKEHACDRPRHPGNVPSPDLTGRTGLIACGRLTLDWGLGSTPVMLQSIGAQNAVETRFRGQISPLIG